MRIAARHLPPGTSQWNNIEDRMIYHITLNPRGRPLVCLDAVVNLAGFLARPLGIPS